jgi:hypothetical protein
MERLVLIVLTFLKGLFRTRISNPNFDPRKIRTGHGIFSGHVIFGSYDRRAMPRPDTKRALAASAAIVGAALLGCAAVVGRYRQQQTELEQFLLVPMNGPMLFSHPGGVTPPPRCALLLPGGGPAVPPARGAGDTAPVARGPRRARLVRLARAASAAAAVMAGVGVRCHRRPNHAVLERAAVPQGITRQLHPHAAGSDVAGMPGNGYSGRANNLEDYTDPYGGGDVPGPYGNATSSPAAAGRNRRAL